MIEKDFNQELKNLKNESTRAIEQINTTRTTTQRAIETLRRDFLKRFHETEKQRATMQVKLDEVTKKVEEKPKPFNPFSKKSSQEEKYRPRSRSPDGSKAPTPEKKGRTTPIMPTKEKAQEAEKDKIKEKKEGDAKPVEKALGATIPPETSPPSLGLTSKEVESAAVSSPAEPRAAEETKLPIVLEKEEVVAQEFPLPTTKREASGIAGASEYESPVGKDQFSFDNPISTEGSPKSYKKMTSFNLFGGGNIAAFNLDNPEFTEKFTALEKRIDELDQKLKEVKQQQEMPRTGDLFHPKGASKPQGRPTVSGGVSTTMTPMSNPKRASLFSGPLSKQSGTRSPTLTTKPGKPKRGAPRRAESKDVRLRSKGGASTSMGFREIGELDSSLVPYMSPDAESPDERSIDMNLPPIKKGNKKMPLTMQQHVDSHGLKVLQPSRSVIEEEKVLNF